MGRSAKYVGDAAVKRLLVQYHSPTPFHVVRMRFLGEIVSPAIGIGPGKTINSFWPDGMPDFPSRLDSEKVFGALMGLWTVLSRHQKGVPVKLYPLPELKTWGDVATALKIRREELHEGFLTGMSVGGMEESLPSPLIKAVDGLKGIASLLGEMESGLGSGSADTDGLDQSQYETLLKSHTASMEALLGAIAVVSTTIRRNLAATKVPTSMGGDK